MTATVLLAGALLTAGATAAQASPQSGTPSLRGPFTSQSVCDVQRTKLLAKMDGTATDCAYYSPPILQGGLGLGWYFEFYPVGTA